RRGRRRSRGVDEPQDHERARSDRRRESARGGAMTVRVGLGFDVHPFVGDGDGRPLVLGGVTIDGAPGLAGHSDADVVAHAVADALLGAAGLPDLGTLYPASDGEHAGASSLGFLADIAARLAGDGWRIGNVDVVVAAERPRLAPHLAAMTERTAAALAPAAGDGEAP